MNVEKIVQNIQRICHDKGTTPTVAARESGAGKTLVTNLKNGIIPSIERFQLLAEHLGVTTSELLGEQKEPASEDTGGLTEEQEEIVRLYDQASPELQAAALAMLRAAEAQRRAPGCGGEGK